MIELQSVSKVYGQGDNQTIALNEFSLQVNAGNCLALLGRSGCGKSTAMHLMGLLDQPSSGQYRLAGENVAAWDSDTRAAKRNAMIGFVFQHFFLLPRLSVLENICLPLNYRQDPGDAQAQAMALLEKLSMADFAERSPSTLSGGQQQRVAIARALIGQPSILLADEPTGALDLETGQQVMDLLLELNQQDKVTLVIVTHNEFIAGQCQRVVHLS